MQSSTRFHCWHDKQQSGTAATFLRLVSADHPATAQHITIRLHALCLVSTHLHRDAGQAMSTHKTTLLKNFAIPPSTDVARIIDISHSDIIFCVMFVCAACVCSAHFHAVSAWFTGCFRPRGEAKGKAGIEPQATTAAARYPPHTREREGEN